MAVVAGVCRAGRNGFAESQSQAVDSATGDSDDWAMSEIIYPRSPRETMDGWMHLPRYIDKIRLHLAGRLHADYQKNPSPMAKCAIGCAATLKNLPPKKPRTPRIC
jgi:hypothetical protein